MFRVDSFLPMFTVARPDQKGTSNNQIFHVMNLGYEKTVIDLVLENSTLFS